MLAPLRLVLLVASVAAAMYGNDITVPLDDGNILIQHAQFIRVFGTAYKIFIPELSFTLTNTTSSEWTTLDIEVHIQGICKTEPKEWTLVVHISPLGADGKEYKSLIGSLSGRIDECRTETITANLVLAESQKWRIDGVSGERTDLEALRKQREAEEVAEAAEQAKKEAAAAARRKRLAAEQKKKDDELNARLAKERGEEAARSAEERRKVRVACSTIYKTTADTKIKDLTVREEQQVRTCQALGLYPPQ